MSETVSDPFRFRVTVAPIVSKAFGFVIVMSLFPFGLWFGYLSALLSNSTTGKRYPANVVRHPTQCAQLKSSGSPDRHGGHVLVV